MKKLLLLSLLVLFFNINSCSKQVIIDENDWYKNSYFEAWKKRQLTTNYLFRTLISSFFLN